ncbi:pre-toxin TG domain-containing protein [Streptococcus suis]|uniref:pre-toxin TG domain-containing protein n=1 Tax=Streptococcus suis TaxID=1307 RepID=UPI001ABE1D65|nr:type IV secretion protein Rhs [Streptococcus suis]
MTKNVELHLHKWNKMKGALGSVTENGSGGGFSGGSYSSWGGPAMSSYSGIGGSGSQGFANRIKSLVEITEKAKRAINDLDVDGAIGNLHFHDDHVTAISLQSKLTALETYAGKVQQYLKDKIDQPFYEKLDKVGDRLEALNISDYKTSNQIGFKKTEVIYSEAGQYMGTREVLAKEVGLKELYQVDNPYKTRLQAMYDSYKSSDDYKESKLTEEDYIFASHQTRAFTYHSLNDEKAVFEGKRDLLLAAGVVILTIFCPPAGAVAGVALAAADMYSAASGKDWMTGRELDDGERLMRGAFALFDLVPGVGYLNDLAKTGKVAGLAGIKASLKTSFKEGMEQAAKNVDNFKVVLKNVDDFGKRVVTKIDDFGKQLDNLVTNKVSSLADNVAGKLRHVDETLSTAAQNFSLNNIGFEPQLVSGAIPSPPPGRLSGVADNLQAFAKSLSGSVDDVVIPSVRDGEFNKWFDSLTSEEFIKLWDNPQIRKIIEDRIRKPGGYHEWHLVSRTPKFKSWGVSMDDIKEMRTLTIDVEFINPPGRHGGRGSTKAHNEILKIIDSASTYEDFVVELNEWAKRRMKNGILDLPIGLRR